MPVIETGVGNCHVYVDAAADLDMALAIVVNAKAQRPGVCNAAETLLVHARRRPTTFLPRALAALAAAGVELHGDAARRGAIAPASRSAGATDDDWDTEYLVARMAVARRRLDLDAAIAHIAATAPGTPRRS